MSTEIELLRKQLNAAIGTSQVVNIVGNASSLLETKYGEEIDAGCVVRMNSGIPTKRTAQGRRTNIHCFSTRSSLQYNLGRAHWRVRLRRGYFNKVFSVWMSAGERDQSTRPGQSFYPISMLEELSETLGSPPSVGAKAIHMISELTNVDIKVFGFDFKATQTFYRTKENLGPHDWAAEARYAQTLADIGRIKILL